MRYVAAAGPDGALVRLSRDLDSPGNPRLRPVLAAPGVRVWVVPGTPSVVDEGGRAAAVGLLFERHTGRCVTRLPRPLPPANAFVDRFWGTYVLCAGDGTGHAFLREPSGNVTAYHRRAGPLDVYASDAALLRAATSAPIVPDLAFLRHWLTFPFLRAGLGGWTGTSEILPGSSRRTAGNTTTDIRAWDPWTYADREGMIDDPAAAAATLREAVLHAVPRLAEAAADPVVRLSGGLDSAIVAAALAHSGRPFRAVTFATRAPDGDERPYARAAARHWGIALAELVEERVAPEFDRPPSLAMRPPANALLQLVHRVTENHFAATGADLVLGGTGGDNVFCYLGSASPLLDALRARGPAAALAAARDLACLHGTTLRRVVRAAYRRARRPRATWRRDETFLAPGAAAAGPASHPWLEPYRGDLRGKFEHVQSIVSIRHFLADPAYGRTPALHPLLAQPVLETCLRIPTWLWMRGGRDRAIARMAFGDLLPPAVRARRTKGALGSMVMGGYMAARRQLEPLLLEGRLGCLGLLDRDAVAAYLRQDHEPRDPGYIRLLDIASAEAWLRGFED